MRARTCSKGKLRNGQERRYSEADLSFMKGLAVIVPRETKSSIYRPNHTIRQGELLMP